MSLKRKEQTGKNGKINKFKIIGTKSSVRSMSYLKASSLLACDKVPLQKARLNNTNGSLPYFKLWIFKQVLNLTVCLFLFFSSQELKYGSA